MGGPARDLRTAKIGHTNPRSHRRRLPCSSANSGLTDPLQIRCPKAGEVYHHSVIDAKGRGHALPSVFRWKFLYPTGVRCGTSSAHNPAATRMATTCQQRAPGPGFPCCCADPTSKLLHPNCCAVIAPRREPRNHDACSHALPPGSMVARVLPLQPDAGLPDTGLADVGLRNSQCRIARVEPVRSSGDEVGRRRSTLVRAGFRLCYGGDHRV
jgi:hypothetical protein